MYKYIFVIFFLVFSRETSLHSLEALVPQIENHSLIALPEARASRIDRATDPFLTLIDCAAKEILLSSYKLQEHRLPQKDMLGALEAAVKRGVSVYLIGEDRLSSMEKIDRNEQGGEKAYIDRGVKVIRSKKYEQSHTKFIIVDSKEAIIGTTNFDKEDEGHMGSERPARDFAVRLSNVEVISELTRAFWNDYQEKDEFEPTSSQLLWGPEGQREKLKGWVERAQNSIRIYQQSIQDEEMVDALILAVKCGVEVELIMSPHPFGLGKPDRNIPHQKKLAEAGVKVYLTRNLNIHAKVMIVDDQLMYLGSTNFYGPAIDHNRNVGLLTRNENLVKQVLNVFKKDKEQADLLTSL